MKSRRKIKIGRMMVTLLFLATVTVCCLNYYQQELRLRAINREKEELIRRRDELMIEESRLKRLLEYTKTDNYVEQYVRDRLGWIKDGEIIIKTDE